MFEHVKIARNISGNIASKMARCGFPAIFERLTLNLLSVDGSAAQLPAILLDVDAPLGLILMQNSKGDYEASCVALI